MSKTAQRKRQAYLDGFLDGKQGNGIAWRTHPFLAQYKAGHKAGLAVYNGTKRRGIIQQPVIGKRNFIHSVRKWLNTLRVL